MKRKTFFTVIIILLIILLSIVFINKKSSNEPTTQQLQTITQATVSPTLPPSVPQTIFQLFPNPAQPDSEGNIDIEVSMNSYNNRVTAVQFTVQYDPAALHFVSIIPDDAFYNAAVLNKIINETTGTITYSLMLPHQLMNQPARGNYDIAEIEFTAKHPGTTSAKILSGSVTSPDSTSSVLKSIAGTTVNLNE